MPSIDTIQVVPFDKVDTEKWDDLISQADNGLIYAYSCYLDHMAKHCDALVLNDYEAVMPLTWNRKAGFYYLYQPAFTPCLGVFGKNLTEERIRLFLKNIPEKFRLTEINLNTGNRLPELQFLLRNQVLDLGKPYEELNKQYRENHTRNIRRAEKTGCKVNRDVNTEQIISLHQQFVKQNSTDAEDFMRFSNLVSYLEKKLLVKHYGVLNQDGSLYAGAVFFFSHQRAYYILAASHPDGKTTGAAHFLIDAFIKDHAGEKLVLDFEGSQIPGLARFYEGFGAMEEFYPAIRKNNLPFFIRWLKQ